LVMNKTKKKFIIVLAGLIGIVSIIGISYAYWMLSFTQTVKNTLATACFSIEFTDADDINLQNTYPISDSEGEALTPYTFTITNKCNDYASYQVNLEVLNSTTLNTNYVKTKFNNSISLLKDYEVVTKTLDDATTSYKLITGYLDKNESVTYDLRLWMDYDTPASDDAMNKLFTSKITITASYIDHIPTEYELCVGQNGVVQCNVLANLDSTAACPTVNADGTVNVTAEESTNGYICKAKDDYGDSYYYRGNVTNNYVKFGGYYWRIIRINGDGSIRMIYAGDANVIDSLGEATKQSVLANGYDDWTTKYSQIGESEYNGSDNNNAYVGYMYGDINGTTYEEVHANTNESSMKKYLDNWYKEHIFDTEYEQYISDTLFCNDRSISPYIPSGYLNTGIGTDTTAYRWYYGPWDDSSTKNNPTLSCKQQNDRFTKDDTTVGNAALDYAIGLISIDEMVLAGGYNTSNHGYYLYTGYNYWTMFPNEFTDTDSYASMKFMSWSGAVIVNGTSAIFAFGVRPVINLKAGSLRSGTGVWNDPYKI